MKIKSFEGAVEIFAIFWENEKTDFLVYSKKHDKFLRYNESQVNIEDTKLRRDFIFHKNGIYYKPLIEEKKSLSGKE
mgnify:CR=1 FL=1